MSFFEFGGMNTANIPGLLVEAKSIYGLPERDVEKIHVPGRNGDVLIDYGSYQNVTATYQCAVTRYEALYDLGRLLTVGPQTASDPLRRAWEKLSTGEFLTRFTPWQGYQLLRDGWAKHERLAVVSTQIPMEEIIANHLLRFTVAFDCKPQKYYSRAAVVQRSGAGSVTINRPVGAVLSAPRIEIVGSGTVTLTLEGQTISLTGLVTPPMTGGEYQYPSALIDSEAMVACRYKAGGVRENLDIAQWPQFWQLVHTVSATGGVTRLQIWPRWWSI